MKKHQKALLAILSVGLLATACATKYYDSDGDVATPSLVSSLVQQCEREEAARHDSWRSATTYAAQQQLLDLNVEIAQARAQSAAIVGSQRLKEEDDARCMAKHGYGTAKPQSSVSQPSSPPAPTPQSSISLPAPDWRTRYNPVEVLDVPDPAIGMLVGDVVRKVNGVDVTQGNVAAVMAQFQGKPITFTIERFDSTGVGHWFDLPPVVLKPTAPTAEKQSLKCEPFAGRCD